MTWLFRRKRPQPVSPWDLSIPLLNWVAGSPFSIGDACQGVGIFGSTGAGKSTGSYAAIINSYLRSGFGGVFFTVKPEDTLQYIKLVREAGRLDDLLIFSPEHTLRYGFIAEELRRGADGAGTVENLASLILTVVELLERSKERGGGGDRFFMQEGTRLLRNGILVLTLAKGIFTMADLHQLIVSAPQSAEELQSESWQRSSFCYGRRVCRVWHLAQLRHEEDACSYRQRGNARGVRTWGPRAEHGVLLQGAVEGIWGRQVHKSRRGVLPHTTKTRRDVHLRRSG